MTKIRIAQSPDEILHCLPAIRALRPNVNESNVLDLISGMISRGYHLLYIDDNGKASCICGYRFTEHLAWGRVIYIDDLGTIPDARGKGYASSMIEYVFSLAKKFGLNGIHLDSGSIPQRYDAHRLYLNKGFNITSYHFAKNL